MNFEWNKRNIFLIIVFVFLIIVFSIVYNFRYETEPETEEEKIVLVTDDSRFFTISNCAERYINYLAGKDAKSLTILLSNNYKEINGINESNILNKLEALSEGEYAFKARKMYQEKLTENMIKYYIYGHLNEIIMDTYIKPTDYYLIVTMDTVNFTYSITPYAGNIFRGA